MPLSYLDGQRFPFNKRLHSIFSYISSPSFVLVNPTPSILKVQLRQHMKKEGGQVYKSQLAFLFNLQQFANETTLYVAASKNKAKTVKSTLLSEIIVSDQLINLDEAKIFFFILDTIRNGR